jgi:AraC-like DNA-binding protein
VLVYDDSVQPGQKTVWLIRPTMEFVDPSEVAGGMDKLNAVYSDNFDSWLVIGGNDGLQKVTLKSTLFTNYVTDNKDDIPGYNSMRGICRDQAGNILFTGEMSGVHMLTTEGVVIKPGAISPSLAGLDEIQYLRTILKMGDSMLLIAHSAGLTSYFPLQKRLEIIKLPIGVSAMALGKDELMATLNSVLGIRAKLQERYANYSKETVADVPRQAQDNENIQVETLPETLPDAVIWQDGVLQLENEFLHQLYTYISERLEDANLSAEQVSQAMGRSQSVLYRKLTALTGQSLVPFIRTIRMQKAKTLLLQTSKSVSEVAYETGFTDSKFFSKVFQQEFGMRPKAFRSNADAV